MHLIASHIPEINTTYFSSFQNDSDNDEIRHRRAKCLHAVMMALFPNCTGATNFSFQNLLVGKDILELDVYFLVAFLYQALPQFVPKATIDFKGPLHDKVTRYIDISNTSSRSVGYQYYFASSADFSLDVADITATPTNYSTPISASSNAVSIPARSSLKIPISFTSRFARSVKDQVTFKSKKMGLNNNSVLVFLLTGAVERMTPKKTFRIEAPMYCTPPVKGELEITNPFSVPGRFRVTLSAIKVSEESILNTRPLLIH
jgi:hypothetical protein